MAFWKLAKEKGSKAEKKEFRYDPINKIVYEKEPDNPVTKQDEEEFSNRSIADKLDLVYSLLKKVMDKQSQFEIDWNRKYDDIMGAIYNKR